MCSFVVLERPQPFQVGRHFFYLVIPIFFFFFCAKSFCCELSIGFCLSHLRMAWPVFPSFCGFMLVPTAAFLVLYFEISSGVILVQNNTHNFCIVFYFGEPVSASADER